MLSTLPDLGKAFDKFKNSTMNTTESKEYIEPIGFKGTKGVWRRSYKKYKIISDTFDSITGQDICEISGDYDLEEIKANAILLSQSKEMAKTVQDLIERMDRCRTVLQTSYNHKGFWGVLDTEKAKEVINKALNI